MMTLDIEKLLQLVAMQHNTTIDIVRLEIQNTINIAYENKNLEIKNNFIELFGSTKPTIEDFLLKTISKIK